MIPKRGPIMDPLQSVRSDELQKKKILANINVKTVPGAFLTIVFQPYN
jgi:hypothetical protein